MEIQSFMLATKITKRPGGGFDVEQAALHSLQLLPDTSFPIEFTLPSLMVLRREITSDEEPIRLEFDLVDQDGRNAGLPRQSIFEETFPAGSRFLFGVFQIAFEFPRPGQYQLNVTTDDPLEDFVYRYGIEVTQRRSRKSSVRK